MFIKLNWSWDVYIGVKSQSQYPLPNTNTMEVIAKSTHLLKDLQSFEVFEGLPEEALKWLIEKSEFNAYKAGEHIFTPGQAVDHMQVIIKGKYVIEIHRQGSLRELGVYERGYITGVLPFSRMKEASAYGKVLEDCEVLELHKKHFTEMVNVSYELTQSLVATMSNRIREFSQLRFQTEKLTALGRLSAGLAHELNNPASAIVRDVSDLYKKIHKTPERFKAVITMRVTPEETDAVNNILFSKLKNLNSIELSLLEREEKTDELLDWLEDQGIEEAEDIADTFVDFGVSVEELNKIHDIVQGRHMPALMWWIESTLSLEKLVCDIRDSSERIADLIGAIKTYTHMDRGSARESINIHEGIKSTLIMLKHKLRQKNIEVVKDIQLDLPPLKAHPGELNQVWTNLIDNAIDAMDKDGTLTIKTYQERQYLCVEIIDSGAGIPEEEQTVIFEPFFTTKPMGKGTGMGLEIVKRIVDRHHGTIRLESRPGRTCFKLCFPLN
jgi:signal transduction histidine kinase